MIFEKTSVKKRRSRIFRLRNFFDLPEVHPISSLGQIESNFDQN